MLRVHGETGRTAPAPPGPRVSGASDAGSRRRATRLQWAGAIALLLVSTAFFAGRCALDPAIPFVVQRGDAPWIMFPAAPTGLMGLAPRAAPPITTFNKSFQVPAEGASRVVLSLRAMRSFRALLNGTELTGPNADLRHWARFRRLDVTHLLRPGANALRVEVTNPTGPGLLSLRLEGLPRPLASDASWTVSVAGGPTQKAILASDDRVNPSGYALDSPLEALAARRDTVLLLFTIALLLHLGTRSAPGGRLLPPLLRALPWLACGVWGALFWLSMLKIPLRVGFDAHHHMAYVDFLREHGALPLASDGWMMFHPPLFYAATAALVELQRAVAPAAESLLAWRLLPFLAGLGNVWLCRALARRLFPGSPRDVAFATLFAAILPMNLYIASYLTNESLQTLLASGVVLGTAALLLAERPSPRGLLGLGALMGLALLTKYTAVIVTCVATFFLAAKWALAERAPAPAVAKRLGALAAVVLGVAGWFYVRNLLHFQQLFPLNVDLPGQTLQWWSPPGYYTPAFFLRFGEVLAHPFLAGYHSAWDALYSTLWGDGFLAGQVVAARRHPFWDYQLMAIGYLLALPATLLLALGGARALRLAFRDPDAGRRAVWCFLLTLAWALLVSVLFMTLRQQDYGQSKAFYGLAVMAPLSIFFTLGCGAIDDWLATPGRRALRAVFYGWLGSFAAVALLSYAS